MIAHLSRIVLAVLLAVRSLGAQVATPRTAGASTLSDSAIREIITKRVDDKVTTGIAVGIIGPDGAQRVISHGSSGTPRPIDAQTVFEIGSITKAFTGAILADMVARGEVSLDDPVAKHLPPPATVPSRKGRHITLRDLATHSSGLPPLPSNFAPRDPANPYADYTVQQTLDFVASHELRRDIGATYEYSNLGFGILGIALAHRAGTTYGELVRQRILDPLGMTDTRIELTPALRERLALGHDPAGTVVSNWDIPGLAGTGALRSTMADMLKFLAANMDAAATPLGPSLAAAQQQQRSAGSGNMRVGLGWHILAMPSGSRIVWHNGGTGGYRSFTGFDPVRKVGVVVLTNGATSSDDIGLHLIDDRLPLQAPVSPQGARGEIAVASETLERYVGEYQLAPTFSIVITREGSTLHLQATNQPKFQIFAEKEDEFFLKVVDAQIRFTRDGAGTVTGLVLIQNGRNTPGRKIR